jgi:ubiquinone/menaquinone biosynthesis C-methylase UbiE
MTKQEFSKFSSVDRTPDPEAFVRFLDTINQIDLVQMLKKQTLDLLQVQPGDHILDVGCGLGDVVKIISEMVGANGRAVGIDQSETMLTAAKARITDSAVELKHCRAQELDFPDNTFDGCRADRVLLYVDDPNRVLSEMVRVTKPGGRVVNFEPDWQTMVVDTPNKTLTRKIADFWCDSLPNPWIGRQLPRMHKDLGLTDNTVLGLTLTLPTYKLFNDLFMVEATVASAVQAGVITAGQSEEWLGSLKDADSSGQFFFGNTGYLVSGRKPE